MTWPAAAAFARGATLVVALLAAACSPTFDWRQARPEGTGVTMLFPCRPTRLERKVPLAGATVAMQMTSCAAGGATFSLVAADALAADRVAPLMAALQAQARANIGGVAATMPAASGVPGAILRIEGRLPDGRPVVEHAVFFVEGTRLFQAAVVRPDKAADAEVLDTFFAAIRPR